MIKQHVMTTVIIFAFGFTMIALGMYMSEIVHKEDTLRLTNELQECKDSYKRIDSIIKIQTTKPLIN